MSATKMTQITQKLVSTVAATWRSRRIKRVRAETAAPASHIAGMRGVYHLAALAVGVILLTVAVPAQQGGTLSPIPRPQFLDNNGVPCAGCSLYTYLSGTSTPAATYQDAALSTPNANPIILDSAGRTTIYLDPSAGSYKYILKTTGAVTLWTSDGISVVPPLASSDNGIVDGRMSAVSGNPAPVVTPFGSTIIYYMPYRGNRIALYDGTSLWRIYTFAQLSIDCTGDTANLNYDLFVYANSGVVTLERVAWAGDTARATALVLQDGVYVKSGATTRRYLGTYRKETGTNVIWDDPIKRWVWNYYNRIPRQLQYIETTDSWTYTTGTYRQALGSTANQVSAVVGVAEVPITLDLLVTASNTSANVAIGVAIGEDSTTTPISDTSGHVLLGVIDTYAAGYRVKLQAHLDRQPAIGYHFWTWLEESSAVGTTTWYGDGGAPTLIQSGISGVIIG